MSEITLKIEITLVLRTREIINISPNTRYLHYRNLWTWDASAQTGSNLQVSDDRLKALTRGSWRGKARQKVNRNMSPSG
jgi:hypothetical protein